jgi:hypothetical protein
MNLLNKYLCLILLLAAVYPHASAAQDSLHVKIKTDNDSSYIYIDGKYYGRGSAEVFLNTGKYVVKVSEPGYFWNAKSVIDTLRLDGLLRDTSIVISLNSTYYLETAPENASVILGDTTAGYTPLFLSGSQGKIILKKTGYAEKTLESKTLKEDDIVKLKYIGPPEEQSFFKTDAFKILVGGIVVLGGATAYFKLNADKRFDTYQATGDKAYLDQTRKLDVISGIFMGALQINFGVLIYYFLTD